MKELGVNIWLRCVDDIFATLRDAKKANEILDFLNKQHPNIKFTIEHEKDNRLPFLDTTVYRGYTSFKTTLYRKKTFTGVYLNWTSLTCKRYKIGLIYCLLDRIWKICSEIEARDTEINKLREILARNEYPDFIVDREIEKFMSSRQAITTNNTDTTAKTSKTIKTSEKQLTRFIVLPYVSRKAENHAKKLKNLVEKHYPQVDFNVAFKTPNEIGKFFPFKDNIKQTTSRSLVVYRLKCTKEGCDASYIGKTERILCHRVKEHRTQASSACFQHEKQHKGHHINYDEVEILDSADNNLKLQIKELLQIVNHKPTLNRQLNSQSKFNIKTLIVAAYPQLSDEVATS